MTTPTSTALFTTIVSWIPSLSLGVLISFGFLSSTLAENQNPACVDNNGKQNNCIKITKTDVVEDKVTLRIKATQADGRTINTLDATKIKIKVDGKLLTLSSDAFKPLDTQPPPVRIVMLLDYSGSMNSKDRKRNTKIEGALRGIETFLNIDGVKPSASQSDKSGNNLSDVKISIVPFGTPDKNTCQGNEVIDRLLNNQNSNNKNIIDNFFPIDSAQLRTNIDFYRTHPPCSDTSTNLYEALATTFDVLGDKNNSEFYPTDSKITQPKLFIILLSDGFNTEPFDPNYPNVHLVDNRCNPAHFRKLEKNYLKDSQITVYTLGYGFTPEELGNPKKNGLTRQQLELEENETYADLGHPVRCENVKFFKGEYPVIPSKLFVDEDNLKKIAQETGGFSNIYGDAEGIKQAFTEFREAIFGEYTVTYTQPNADKSSQHQVEVIANYDNQPLSDAQVYTMKGIGGYQEPFPARLIILLVTFTLVGVFGGIPLYFWYKDLQ